MTNIYTTVLALCALSCGEPLSPVLPDPVLLSMPLRCSANDECASRHNCLSARCVACEPGQMQCDGLSVGSCDDQCEWSANGTVCDALCRAGACRDVNSCTVAQDCGSPAAASCCKADVVPGGRFELHYNSATSADKTVVGSAPREVAPFALDRYEVTVGRFRRFVANYGADTRPSAGDGAYPGVPESGWNAAWNEDPTKVPYRQDGLLFLLGDSRALLDDEAAQHLPMPDVNWFIAFAFCIWDDARLPTEAEWAYAAEGGRGWRYPWGDAALDSDRAWFGAPGTGPHPVGLKARGQAEYGHHDLAGNLQEWVLDSYVERLDQAPCASHDESCVVLEPASLRVLRGGSYADSEAKMQNGWRASRGPQKGHAAVGFRCARSLNHEQESP